jgi:Sec-independent protein translocase protein TatA
MPFGMGFGELILILVIVVVVFGGTKLPPLSRSLERWFDCERLMVAPSPRDWKPSDWLLVLVTATLVLVAVALFAHQRSITG